MNDWIFLITWACGLVIMSSISYMSFQVMEAWIMRQVRRCAVFGVFVSLVELLVLTLFAYYSSNEMSTVDTMVYTMYANLVAVPLVWVTKRTCKIETMSR